MMWINFLHFYQPATLDKELVIEAAQQSYRRIIAALRKNDRIRCTANIQGCLLDQLRELGCDSLLKDIAKLAQSGRLELTGSVAYHPIIPLIPEYELRRQITLHEQAVRRHIGDVALKGFFMPEMAYSAAGARVIKSLGYEWVVLDEISANGSLNRLDCTQTYRDQHSDLTLVFRNRYLSQSYVPRTVAKLLEQRHEGTVITATDAELYGLRHRDFSGQFEKVIKHPSLQTQTVSEFIAGQPPAETVAPVPSSWESSERELAKRIPYALWQHPRNRVQKKIWELAALALNTVSRHEDDVQYQWAEWRLHRGLASCTFWWASANFMPLGNTIAWNPDEIERGVEELIKSIRALDKTTTRLTKIKAEKLYITIKRLIWKKHWTYYWKR